MGSHQHRAPLSVAARDLGLSRVTAPALLYGWQGQGEVTKAPSSGKAFPLALRLILMLNA